MKFIVSRKKWYRGQGKAGSMLRRPDGQMCCLGHCALQCGIPEEKIQNVGAPASLCGLEKSMPDWMSRSGEVNGDGAMDINDMENITEREREKRLRAFFKQHGDQIVFRP